MKIAEICVKRPIFAVMLIAFLVTLGIFSFRSLGVDLFPRVDPATVNVSVSLPGTSPEEMVSSVVLPLEDAISSVSGLDEMNVRTTEGSASITSTFKLERDIESATQDIREKVAAAMKYLPPNVLPPVIQKVDPDSDPILSVVVSGPMERRELTEIADKVVRRGIQTVDGVGEVDLVGGQAREIRILIDAERLTAHNLTVAQVRDAVVKENVEQPGGHVIHGPEDVDLRTLGRVTKADQFGDIIIAYRGGAPVRVRDIGQVEDGAEELKIWAMLKGKDVVTVQVRRQTGTNTVQIADDVKRRVESLKRQVPPSVHLQVIGDISTFIRASVDSLLEHLILGSILASIVVLLFIRNLRAVIIASLAIPASVISTFTLLKYMDFTLNNMTLLALTLAVGIVIDDAIIVLENIFRYMEEKGVGPVEAAIQGTREIGLAVMATTLSLVIIFLPIAFMTGYARRYVNSFGWTMALAIMVSMLVSFTLTPMLSSRVLKLGKVAGHHGSRDTRFARWLDHTYTGILEWALDHRAKIVAICVAVFLATFPLYRLVGRDWIPYDDQNELNVGIDFPEGQSLDRTTAIFNDMASKIEKMPEVQFVEAYTQGQTNHGHLYVRLVDRSQRKLSSMEFGGVIRKFLQQGYRNIMFTVRLPTVLGGENYSPIRAVIRGPDVDKLAVYGVRAANAMREYPGMVDINPDLRLNKPELEVKVDRQRAADLGVSMADVGSAVRLMYSGEDEISTFKEGSEQYPVVMQLQPEQRDNMDVLARLMVPSATQGQVRLASVATIERGAGPQTLSRYNRQFQNSVTAQVARGYPLDAAADATSRAIRSLHLPPAYSFGFSGPVRILNETTLNMILAVALASIFMYMVLAAQFESFSYPFIIMLTLPLSIPFALFSLWITHRTLNLWSALGVFLLLGIVKKNGILQVDYTNRLRGEGMPLREALIEANRVRLRPILMTTFSIVAGLIPVALGIGAGSEQRAAIAVTIIGGQSLCLILTLLVVPVAYSYMAQLGMVPWGQHAGLFWGRLRTQLARRFGLF
jgi:hydrophobic/amphiphilic exporter-1 (mainly G- bacteria), HAE1 family